MLLVLVIPFILCREPNPIIPFIPFRDGGCPRWGCFLFFSVFSFLCIAFIPFIPFYHFILFIPCRHEHADAARRPPPDRILGFLDGSIQNVPKAPSVRNRDILPGGGRRTAAAWSRQKHGLHLPIQWLPLIPFSVSSFLILCRGTLCLLFVSVFAFLCIAWIPFIPFYHFYAFYSLSAPATTMPTPLGGPRLTESLAFFTDRSRMFRRPRVSEIGTFCQAGAAEQPRHGRGRKRL